MNPTCRHLMRYRTPGPRSCRHCVTDLRDPLGPLAETVVIHPARDVDQTKRATTDAMKSGYFDNCIYKLQLLMPCTASGWLYADWHGRLLSHETPWRAVVRQVGLLDLRVPNSVR